MRYWFPVLVSPERFAEQMAVFARLRDIEAESRAARRLAEVIPLVQPAAPISLDLYFAAVA